MARQGGTTSQNEEPTPFFLTQPCTAGRKLRAHHTQPCTGTLTCISAGIVATRMHRPGVGAASSSACRAVHTPAPSTLPFGTAVWVVPQFGWYRSPPGAGAAWPAHVEPPQIPNVQYRYHLNARIFVPHLPGRSASACPPPLPTPAPSVAWCCCQIAPLCAAGTGRPDTLAAGQVGGGNEAASGISKVKKGPSDAGQRQRCASWRLHAHEWCRFAKSSEVKPGGAGRAMSCHALSHQHSTRPQRTSVARCMAAALVACMDRCS